MPSLARRSPSPNDATDSRRTSPESEGAGVTAAGLAPLARFHLHVGTRLALRAAAPLAGLPLAFVLLQHDPSGALRALAAWLLGPSGGTAAGLAIAGVCLALAGWAAPRVTSGLAGWPRHLPVTASVHRRAALVALATAQSPLLLGLLLLLPAAAHQAGGISLARLAALLSSVGAAAVASWPGTRAVASRALSWAALALAATARPGPLAVGLCLVLVAESVAGPLAAHDASARRRRSSPLPLALLVTVRALGPAAVGALLASLLPVAAMALLRVNNELPPAVAAGAARLGGGTGVVVLLSLLGERLAIRRPVWPWARSLPAGARRRVAEDAILLAVPCLVPLGATAGLDPLAALTGTACLPLLSLVAAAALRAPTPGKNGGAALVGGALLASAVALLPVLSLLALAASPLALRAAIARDRAQKASLWDERHHRAIGDPLAWSSR